MFSSDSTKKFFQAITETEGIKINYDRDVVIPCSRSNGAVTLPPPNEVMLDQWEGMAHKEVSFLYQENRWLLNDYSKGQGGDQGVEPKTMAKRILCDHIAERSRYGEYPGRDQALSRNRARITKEIQKEYPELLDSKSQLDKEGEVLKSLLHWDLNTRKQFMEYELQIQQDFASGSLTGEEFENVLDSGVMECKSQGDISSLIEELFTMEPPPPSDGDNKGDDNDDKGDDSDEGDQEGQEGQNDSGSGDDGQGDQEEESEESEESEGEDSDSEGDSESSDDERGADGEGDDEQGSESFNLHDDGEGDPGQEVDSDGDGTPTSNTIIDDHKGTGGVDSGVKLDWGKASAHFKDTTQPTGLALREKEEEFRRLYKTNRNTNYIPIPKQKFYTAAEMDVMIARFGNAVYPGTKAVIERYLQNSTVSRNIKKYLVCLAQDSFIHGQSKGKVSSKSIHRLYSGARQPRIFKQKLSTKLKNDTAVMLMMDCSGSMSGTKYNIASACCLALSETLASIKMAHEILGFTENYVLETYEFKGFGENILIQKLLNRLLCEQIDPGCNADGESIALGAERLLARPEKNKVMIVLSDGQPAGSFIGCGASYLKEVCRKIEEETPIKLHGIGICSQAVENYYTSSQVVSDPADLDSAMMELLKSQVIT